MEEWLDVQELKFDNRENENFKYLIQKINKVQTWGEEDFKMKFISPIL